VDTNMLFIDNLYVLKEDLIGEEGRGFYYIPAASIPNGCSWPLSAWHR
jgi:hypothetical protein